MPTAKDETIAWVLWHTARIEDLTIGILVADGEQLFNTQWKRRMNTPITDTGNALSDDEIIKIYSGFLIFGAKKMLQDYCSCHKHAMSCYT